MDDQRHRGKRSLADDPNFLASLTDLDRGLGAGDEDEGSDFPEALAEEPLFEQQRPEPPPVEARRPDPPIEARRAPVEPRRHAPVEPRRPAPVEPRWQAPPPEPRRPAPISSFPPPALAPPLPPPARAVDEPGARRPLLELFPPQRVERERPSPPRLEHERPPGPIGGTAIGPRLPQRPVLRPVEVAPPADALTYETFYGLNEKPFSSSTDPKFLYHSTAHDRAAQDLLSAMRQRDGLVVLTGPLGSGKTTLCRAVMEQLDRRTLTSLLVDPFQTVEDLLQTLLVDFGVMSRDDLARAQASRDELSATLQSFLDSLSSLQASAVVIVDEAQNLPIDVLDALRGLSESGGGELRLLQVVLVGQPMLTAMLRQPALRGLDVRVAVRCDVGPLAADEIAGYVMHRLGVAGNSTRVEFDDAAFAKLYAISAGLPRAVNALCDRAMTLGFQASASVITGEMIAQAADDLDISAPVVEASGPLQLVVAVVAFVSLMIAGAGGAAWIFRGDLARAAIEWQHRPSPPRTPDWTLPAAEPLPLLPIPEEASRPAVRRRN